MAVPNVSYKVEVAWDSNWLTPAGSRTWTDISDYVELDQGMSIAHGRSDEVSTADANTLTLTLDNRDGRFTWGNASSPYYPNVKIGKPIRVTATVGGVNYVRFTGLVDEWPVEWPGDTAAFAMATITASSRLARLGISSPVSSAVAKTVEALAPDHYWPLSDRIGSPVAAEASSPTYDLAIANRPTMFAFGTGAEGGDGEGAGLGIDGRNGLRVTGNQGDIDLDGRMEAEIPLISFGPSVQGGITLATFVRNQQPGAAVTTGSIPVDLFDSTAPDPLNATRVGLELYGTQIASSGTVGAGNIISGDLDFHADGNVHHVAVTLYCDGVSSVTMKAYVDGVLAGTFVDALYSGDYTRLRVSSTALTYLYGRLAVWSVPLPDAQIAELASAGLDGHLGDTTDERIERLADWANIPAAEVLVTASAITVDGIESVGAQVEALMRDVETAEAGVLYDDRAGNLVLKSRSARYHASPALTVAFTADVVKGYVPKVDRQGLANVGTGRGPSENEMTYEDAGSREDYGDADYSVETIALDPDEPLQLVAWRINGNSQPRPRVPAPELSVIDFIGGSIAALLGLDVGSKLRLTNAPSQAPNATSADFFVEGYSEAMGVGTWTISPNLTPVTLEDSVFRLDDPTFGQLDAGNVLGL